MYLWTKESDNFTHWEHRSEPGVRLKLLSASCTCARQRASRETRLRAPAERVACWGCGQPARTLLCRDAACCWPRAGSSVRRNDVLGCLQIPGGLDAASLSCRYPFYMLSCIDMDWKVLTWLRYTVWIPVYPLGCLAEGTCGNPASCAERPVPPSCRCRPWAGEWGGLSGILSCGLLMVSGKCGPLCNLEAR